MHRPATLADGELVAVESVNRPGDQLTSRSDGNQTLESGFYSGMLGHKQQVTAKTSRQAVIIGFVSVALLMTPDYAHAQGLFDFFHRLFGGWGGQQLPAEKSGGPAVAYCVRLCDGRYFPLPVNSGTPSSSPDKICSALCPASATKIYTGSDIGQASAADGAPYSKLANAFVYRERMVPDCTCTGKDIGGTVAMDHRSDPTLRPGDIIATKAGPIVFKGSKQLPYQASDFVPAEHYRGLPTGVRKSLAELRVAP